MLKLFKSQPSSFVYWNFKDFYLNLGKFIKDKIKINYFNFNKFKVFSIKN